MGLFEWFDDEGDDYYYYGKKRDGQHRGFKVDYDGRWHTSKFDSNYKYNGLTIGYSEDTPIIGVLNNNVADPFKVFLHDDYLNVNIHYRGVKRILKVWEDGTWLFGTTDKYVKSNDDEIILHENGINRLITTHSSALAIERSLIPQPGLVKWGYSSVCDSCKGYKVEMQHLYFPLHKPALSYHHNTQDNSWFYGEDFGFGVLCSNNKGSSYIDFGMIRDLDGALYSLYHTMAPKYYYIQAIYDDYINHYKGGYTGLNVCTSVGKGANISVSLLDSDDAVECRMYTPTWDSITIKKNMDKIYVKEPGEELKVYNI